MWEILWSWLRREKKISQSLSKVQQELEDVSYRLSVFQEFCRMVVTASAQEIKDLLLSSIGIITHSTDVSLALVHDGNGMLGRARRGELEMEHQDTPIWQSFSTGRPYWGTYIGEISVYAVYPLITKEGILGVLTLHMVQDKLSDGDKRDYLEALVNLAAVALQQAIRHEQTLERVEIYQDKAIRDSLTGLYNRNFLTEHGEKEIERASRHKQPLSFVMFDVDHFKDCNDSHGHSFGDFILKEIAKLSLEGLRGGDAVFRYGGDEFIVILGGSNSIDGAKIANRLRVRIEEYTFKTDEVEVKVTVSLGVAQWQEGETLEVVINRADQALYRAKNEGRNRVRQWEIAQQLKGGNETWKKKKN